MKNYVRNFQRSSQRPKMVKIQYPTLEQKAWKAPLKKEQTIEQQHL